MWYNYIVWFRGLGDLGKVYLTSISTEPLVRVLVGEGQMLKFDLTGRCLGRFPVSFNLGTLQEVDVVSLLLQGSNLEVASNLDAEFVKFRPSKSLAEIVSFLNALSGLIFVGRRDDMVEQTKFSQYLYIFMRGTVPRNLFRGGF